MKWNQDDIIKLTRLWKDGKSSGDISKAIFKTRSAVLGMKSRLGLDKRPNPTLGQQTKQRPIAIVNRMQKPKFIPVEVKLEGQHIYAGHKPCLLDLKPNECHYVIGDVKNDYHYCGLSTEGMPKNFCDFHHRICYRRV